MKSRGVQDKSLGEILQAIMDEGALLCPVHQRRIEFLKEKRRRNNSSHTDYLQRLEERIELIEFETLTKKSLLSHIFLEESDYEIQRITTKLLDKNPKGNLDDLRTIVKTTENSNWYRPGGWGRASRAGQEGGGGGAGGGRCRAGYANLG